jgi:hypothetical protein
MRTIWIKKLLIFSLPISVLPIAIFFMISERVKSDLDNWSAVKKVNLIFMGDSQVQVALNDTIWDDIKCYAAASEPLFYTFYKLKYFSTRLVELKRVAIGINYHSFSSYYDDFIFNESARFRTFHLLSFNKQMWLMRANNQFVKQFFKHVINRFWEECSGLDRQEWLGKFQPRQANQTAQLSTVELRIQEQFYDNLGDVRDFSYLNLSYLDSIITLCNTKGWDLSLFQNPVSTVYFERVPDCFKKNLNDLKVRFSEYVLNYGDCSWPDSLFLPDGDHLNPSGSILFTQRIQQEFNNQNHP